MIDTKDSVFAWEFKAEIAWFWLMQRTPVFAWEFKEEIALDWLIVATDSPPVFAGEVVVEFFVLARNLPGEPSDHSEGCFDEADCQFRKYCEA